MFPKNFVFILYTGKIKLLYHTSFGCTILGNKFLDDLVENQLFWSKISTWVMNGILFVTISPFLWLRNVIR